MQGSDNVFIYSSVMLDFSDKSHLRAWWFEGPKSIKHTARSWHVLSQQLCVNLFQRDENAAHEEGRAAERRITAV